jgi:hypothetical protein
MKRNNPKNLRRISAASRLEARLKLPDAKLLETAARQREIVEYRTEMNAELARLKAKIV